MIRFRHAVARRGLARRTFSMAADGGPQSLARLLAQPLHRHPDASALWTGLSARVRCRDSVSPEREQHAALIFCHEAQVSDAQSVADLVRAGSGPSSALDFDSLNQPLPNARLFSGKREQMQWLGDDANVLLVGLGDAPAATADHPNAAVLHRAAVKRAVQEAKKSKVEEVSVFVPEWGGSGPGELVKWGVLGNHDPALYKSTRGGKDPLHLTYVGLEDDAQLVRDVVLAESVMLARELGNLRAAECTPAFIQEVLGSIMAPTGDVVSSVVGVSDLHQAGMNMLAAVGYAGDANSETAPRLLHATYDGTCGQSDTSVALLGKGITFDTGGLNLKPTNFIETMHMDMCGAAAVVGVLRACVALKLPVSMDAVVVLAENQIDSNAYKPHAVLVQPKGKKYDHRYGHATPDNTHDEQKIAVNASDSDDAGVSVQVGNTDAEGRLCLADGLQYIQKNVQCSTIIDLATLTGACVAGLGEHTAGLFTRDPLASQTAQDLYTAGQQTGDLVWPMPILDPHRTSILEGATQADMCSTGSATGGGACTAAAFLEAFVDTDKFDYVHLDIAGPAMQSKPQPPLDAGSSGFGVQLLHDFLASQD